MVRFFFASLLFAGALASCAPRQQATAAEQFVAVKPVLYKVSEPVVRGGALTIQGRYLGGPASAQIRMGAKSDGQGGFVLPASAIRSWSTSEITLTVPSDIPPGGGYIFVRVGMQDSNGLPYSIGQ